MTSEPASLTSQMQEPDPGAPQEAKKIPLKQKGLDIASQMRSVKQAGPDLARIASQSSTSVEQTLNVISAIEKTLHQKRRQIEEIKSRQEALAREFLQLGQSLESATRDLAQEFAGIIGDLETDVPVAKAPVAKASVGTTPAMSETSAQAALGAVSAASETTAKAPAKTAAAASGTVTNVTAKTAPAASESTAKAPANTAPAASGTDANATAGTAPAASETGAKAEADSVSSTSETGTEKPADRTPETGGALDLDMETSDLPPVPEFLGDRENPSDQKEQSTSRDPGSGARAWWKHGKKG